MAKRRANGEGNIRKRSDGRWEGRYTAGRDPNTGKVIYKNVLAKTQKECKEKLQRAIEENAKVDVIRAKQYTVRLLPHHGAVSPRGLCEVLPRGNGGVGRHQGRDHHLGERAGHQPDHYQGRRADRRFPA